MSLYHSRLVANCVIGDMIHLVAMWRQARGYPKGGATTHTNANSSKKNKLLVNFRTTQFYKLFGQKRRNIYPTLIRAEYTNRLWQFTWWNEWFEARKFARRLGRLQGRAGFFNPVLLAGHQTNGYTRVGKAAKVGKAKKLVKLFTIGVPVFFTRYIYYKVVPRAYPARLILRDEVNKKLGKKRK